VDECQALIGGALQRLASDGGQQVICVTHLPQVAAYGRAVQVEPMNPVLNAPGYMLSRLRYGCRGPGQQPGASSYLWKRLSLNR